jgi:hypothetical protein
MTDIMTKKIDWHLLSIIVSILISGFGSYYMIHRDLKSDMIEREVQHKEDLMQRDIQHKEDIKIIKVDMGKMDEKWERLFTLFVQDKIDASGKKQ